MEQWWGALRKKRKNPWNDEAITARKKDMCSEDTGYLSSLAWRVSEGLTVLRPISCCLTWCFPKLFGIGNSLQIPVPFISMIYILGEAVIGINSTIEYLNELLIPVTSFSFQELHFLFQLRVYERQSFTDRARSSTKREYLISDHDLYLQVWLL